MLTGDALLRLRLFVDEELNFLYVPITKQEMTERRQTVPTGTPDLLVVALDVLGQVKMQHIAHIRLVYAHAESHCGHHDQHIIADKSTLVGFALLAGQPGVIRRHRATPARQCLCQFIYLAA